MNESTTTDTPSKPKTRAAASKANTKTPEDILHELKKKLQQKQKEIQQKQKEIKEDQTTVDTGKKAEKTLTSDLKDLGQAVSEIDTVVKAYEKAYGDIKEEVKTLEDFYTYDFDDIVQQIGNDPKEAIDKVVEKVDGDVDTLEDDVDKLNQVEELQLKGGPTTSLQSAEVDYENAQSGPSGLEKAQKRFDAWKGVQQQIEDTLKALKDLKKSIEEEEGQKNLKLAYFLFTDFIALLSEAKTLKVTESESTKLEDLTSAVLKEKLVAAWIDLAATKEALRTAEDVLHTRQADLDTKTKGLAEAKKNRKDKIVEEINLI